MASQHAARWISQAARTGVRAGVFQATCAPSAIHRELHGFNGVFYTPAPFEGADHQKSLLPDFLTLTGLNRTEGYYPVAYSEFLVKAVEEFKPDAIHVLGLCVNFRNSIRCLNGAREYGSRKFPAVIYSSWGADLDYFPNAFPDELKYIQKFLSQADYHITECKRDSYLARKMGFVGQTLATLPANGGIGPEVGGHVTSGDLRNLILVKGRDESDGDPIGRAMKILDAFELCPNDLKPFQIRILQAIHGDNVKARVARLKETTALDIDVLPFIDTAELYALLSRAYLFIANTINDGLPLSLVEAFATGAYPIHSDLESVRDYIENGVNGTLVPWNDASAIATAIRNIISSPEKFENARLLNRALVEKKLSHAVVRPQVRSAYLRATGTSPLIFWCAGVFRVLLAFTRPFRVYLQKKWRRGL